MHSIHNSYYMHSLPTKVPVKAAQGFLVTTTIQLLMGSAPNLSFFGGAIAATATLIEAFTRPLFRDIFPKYPNMAIMVQMVISYTLALSLASGLTPLIGLSYKTTSLFLPLIATICLNHDFYTKNEGFAAVLETVHKPKNLVDCLAHILDERLHEHSKEISVGSFR